MPSYNRWTGMGNVVSKPVIQQSDNVKRSRAAFTIAINDHRESDALYVDIVVFGVVAENAAAYLDKGRLVLVEGRLAKKTFTDPATGGERSHLYVIGTSVEYVDKRRVGE